MVFGYLFNRRRTKAVYLTKADKSGLRRALLVLAIIFVVHVVLMVFLESMSLNDAIWLTLTTATTTGYGDVSAQTVFGRVTTVFLLYGVGIYLTAKIAGDYLERRSEKRRQKLVGSWRKWNMKEHVVIVNTPKDGGDVYFKRLVSQLRKDEHFKDKPIHLLTRAYPDGLPESLKEMGVTHYTGAPDSEDSFRAVDIDDASTVIILAKDEYDGMYSDALTFDIVSRIHEYGAGDAQVIVECVNEKNRNRLQVAGADAIVRPVRAYPEVLVRAMVAPGSEVVLENLFKHEGDRQRRYNLEVSGESWGEYASKIMLKGFGTPMAYVGMNGEIVCNPVANESFNAKGLIVMVREGLEPSDSDLASIA